MAGVSLAALAGNPSPARAADGTWTGPGAEFTTGANWSGAAVPDGTAIFVNNGAPTAVSVAPGVGIETLRFEMGAPAYTFDLLPAVGSGLAITGAGIVNLSAHAPVLNAALGSNELSFVNAATAGNAVINTAGLLSFGNAATAGTATINNAASGQTQFWGSSTLASARAVNNGGFIAFYEDSSAGSGTIVGNGPGAIQFFDLSTAGNAVITINSGSAVVFAVDASGGNARFIVNAGGTFDIAGINGGGTTAGSIEGAGTFQLGDKTLAVGSRNIDTTVSGEITGTNGNLTKVGTGMLTLAGVNTYTGATTVEGGALAIDGSIAASSGVVVNAGGRLAGVGAVPATTINAGGTLAPGHSLGTLSVSGNLTFAAGSTYAVAIAPAESAKTVVGGAADLSGGAVVVKPSLAQFRARTYTILTAGALNGSFSGVTLADIAPGAGNPRLTYDANHVYLTLDAVTLSGLLAPGAPGNAPGVAAALDAAVNGGTDLPVPLLALYGLPPAQLAAALNQLAGQAGSAAVLPMSGAMTGFLGSIFDFGDAGRGGGAAGFAAEAPLPPAKALAYAAVTPKDARSDHRLFDARWGVWASGFGGGGRVAGDAARGNQDVSSRIYGAAAGADYRLSAATVVGLAMAGGETGYALSGGFGSGRSDYAQGALYGRHEAGPAYVAAAIAGGAHAVKTERSVSVGGATDRLDGRFTAAVIAGRIESGIRFGSAGQGVTPYGAAQVQNMSLPAYAETVASGSGAMALSYAARDSLAARTELGAWFDHRAIWGTGTIRVRARVAWVHDFNRDPAVAAAFQNIPGASFTIGGPPRPADAALLSAAFELPLASDLTLSAKLDGEFSSGAATWSGRGTLRYLW